MRQPGNSEVSAVILLVWRELGVGMRKCEVAARESTEDETTIHRGLEARRQRSLTLTGRVERRARHRTKPAQSNFIPALIRFGDTCHSA